MLELTQVPSGFIVQMVQGKEGSIMQGGGGAQKNFLNQYLRKGHLE